MRKTLITGTIIAFIFLWAIPTWADDSEIKIYLNNISEYKCIAMEVEGIENYDGSDTRTIGARQTELMRFYATAWFLSATTYRWKIKLWSSDDTKSWDELAELELTAQTMFILWPTLLQFYISKETIQNGEVSYNTSLNLTSDIGTLSINAR